MGRTIRNTNRRLLASYRGADGIKTGYTNAAGFNLVASARRGSVRITPSTAFRQYSDLMLIWLRVS